MDIPQVLAVLRPGEDWGPCAQSESSYDDLARTWRSKASRCPSLKEMQAAWADLESGRAARESQARRAEAIGLLMASNEPRDVALRALIRDLYTQMNDLRERLGLTRALEPEVITRVVVGIGDGLGEV